MGIKSNCSEILMLWGNKDGEMEGVGRYWWRETVVSE